MPCCWCVLLAVVASLALHVRFGQDKKHPDAYLPSVHSPTMQLPLQVKDMTGGALTWVNATWPGAAFADQASGRKGGATGSSAAKRRCSSLQPPHRSPVQPTRLCMLAAGLIVFALRMLCHAAKGLICHPLQLSTGCEVRVCGRPSGSRQQGGRPAHTQVCWSNCCFCTAAQYVHARC